MQSNKTAPAPTRHRREALVTHGQHVDRSPFILSPQLLHKPQGLYRVSTLKGCKRAGCVARVRQDRRQTPQARDTTSIAADRVEGCSWLHLAGDKALSKPKKLLTLLICECNEDSEQLNRLVGAWNQ